MSERSRSPRDARDTVRRAAGGIVSLALALFALAPFLWMVSTSLMDEFEVFRYPPALLPARPRWSNYPEALTALPFGRFYVNTLVLAAFSVAGQVITGSTAGYALARFRFAGGGVV